MRRRHRGCTKTRTHMEMPMRREHATVKGQTNATPRAAPALATHPPAASEAPVFVAHGPKRARAMRAAALAAAGLVAMWLAALGIGVVSFQPLRGLHSAQSGPLQREARGRTGTSPSRTSKGKPHPGHSSLVAAHGA